MIKTCLSLISVFTFLTVLMSNTGHAQPFVVGTLNAVFVDSLRNNRQIPVAIYYPALNPGNAVSVATGNFPVISFGHGFVMKHTAYKYLWEALVSMGYVVVFPLTERSAIPVPNHFDFGLDIAFAAKKLLSEGLKNPKSLFYGKIKNRIALMGHSMGGGSAFVGTAYDSTVTSLVTLAAAITNSSAVQAAKNVYVPTLVFAGQNDCITPPYLHQQHFYDTIASDQKVMITVLGGGHCYFADYNFNCALGELTCSPQPTISRTQQQQVILTFLIPWLEFTLNDNQTAWQIFIDSLNNHKNINYQMIWN